MAADGDQLRPSGGSRIASLLKGIIARLRRGASPIDLSQPQRESRDSSQETSGTGRQMTKANAYIQICEENALDAYTLEDALYWHNEIITELSIELNLIHTTKWPRTVKASTCTALEDRINRHAEAVSRLVAILEKNEQFIWQP